MTNDTSQIINTKHPYFLAPRQIKPDYPLFVFLPGMDGTGKLLRTQTESLEGCFDVRCLALPQDDCWSDWEMLSQQVVNLIQTEQAQKSERSVYLCGESFGGCLALKVALRAPELFKRVILVNPASSFRRRHFLVCAASGTRWMPEFLYRASTIMLLPFLAALGRIEPSDRRALLAAMKSVPPKTVRWRLSLLEHFDVQDEHLSQLQPPVLLIAGAADRLLPSVAEVESLASYLPQAQVVVLPYSGHACLLETDIQLCDLLVEQKFLDSQATQKLLTASS